MNHDALMASAAKIMKGKAVPLGLVLLGLWAAFSLGTERSVTTMRLTHVEQRVDVNAQELALIKSLLSTINLSVGRIEGKLDALP